MGNFLRLAGLVLGLTVFVSAAQAHRLDESYVYFNVTDESLSGRIEATLDDIGQIIDIDLDGDGVVSKDELAARSEQVFELFKNAVQLDDAGQVYGLTFDGLNFLDTRQGTYAQLGFTVDGLSRTPQTIKVTYDTPFAVAIPGHAGFAVIESNSRTGLTENEGYISLKFAPGQTTQMLSLVGEPKAKILSDYILFGAQHFWSGFDHMLFFVGLMLPAVMLFSSGRWIAAPTLPGAFLHLVKLASIFAVTNAVALLIAVLTSLQVNTTIVEIVIALSIIAVGLAGLIPRFQPYILWIVMVFGLFHGLGYANILEPLGHVISDRIVGLTGFIVGIELAQIAIILLAFPVLFGLRTWRIYPFIALKLGSIILILLAGLWVFERNTGLVYRLQQALFG
jgi:hypothetical protein